MIAPHPFSTRATPDQAHLRIMETTDIHAHILAYDYYADRPSDTVGLTRTASLIDRARAEAANAILLDNGDFLQGNPLGDYMAQGRGMKAGDTHPVIAAMNALGVEGATLGNHEFNYGLGFLEQALAGAKFPVVSANIVTQRGAGPRLDQTLVRPYVIVKRTITDGAGKAHPIRLGLIGLAPPQIVQWDRHALEGQVTTRDIAVTAAAWVPEMKEAGADLIIALAHTGIDAKAPAVGAENAALALACVDGVDALLTGHQHLVFPSPHFAGVTGVDVARGTVGGKPAVMAGLWGSHLGLIDLLLERDGATWRVARFQTEARPIYRRGTGREVTPTVPCNGTVLAAARPHHAATLAYIRRPVGNTAVPLNSYFALVANDPSLQAVADAQRWYMRQMLRGTPHAGLPLLSAAAPFKAGGRGGPDHYIDVPAGPLAIRNIADLYTYPNAVRAVRITRARLKDWLERSAAIFNRLTPGQPDQPLISPDGASYNFDVIDGVTYRIDLSQPSGYDAKGGLRAGGAARITDLRYRGAPVDPMADFVVVTNSYRVGGGGHFPGASDGAVIFQTSDTNREVIRRHIADQGTITPHPRPTWRFSPLPGTTALFDTGPGAIRHLGAVTGPKITPAGEAPDGFARFRLQL